MQEQRASPGADAGSHHGATGGHAAKLREAPILQTCRRQAPPSQQGCTRRATRTPRGQGCRQGCAGHEEAAGSLAGAEQPGTLLTAPSRAGAVIIVSLVWAGGRKWVKDETKRVETPAAASDLGEQGPSPSSEAQTDLCGAGGQGKGRSLPHVLFSRSTTALEVPPAQPVPAGTGGSPAGPSGPRGRAGRAEAATGPGLFFPCGAAEEESERASARKHGCVPGARLCRGSFRPDPKPLSAECQMFRYDANVIANKSLAGSRSRQSWVDAAAQLRGPRGRRGRILCSVHFLLPALFPREAPAPAWLFLQLGVCRGKRVLAGLGHFPCEQASS